MRTSLRRALASLALLGAVAVATTGCGALNAGGDDTSSSNGSIILIKDTHVIETGARNHLAALKVAKPASMNDYDRDLFPHWLTATTHGWPKADTGCDTREAALLRDGTKTAHNTKCTVTAGTWADPYTKTVVTDAADLDIDHMVPLANAWRSGADDWTVKTRTKYANDPLVEVTTTSKANRAKGDKGPEAWKPPNKEAYCGYAIRWIEVKRKYDLTLNSDKERAALDKMLDTCSVGLFQ
jgi:hypothetical protein